MFGLILERLPLSVQDVFPSFLPSDSLWDDLCSAVVANLGRFSVNFSLASLSCGEACSREEVMAVEHSIKELKGRRRRVVNSRGHVSPQFRLPYLQTHLIYAQHSPVAVMLQLAPPERHRRVCSLLRAVGRGLNSWRRASSWLSVTFLRGFMLVLNVFLSGADRWWIFHCLKCTSFIASTSRKTFSIRRNSLNSITSELTRRTSAPIVCGKPTEREDEAVLTEAVADRKC